MLVAWNFLHFSFRKHVSVDFCRQMHFERPMRNCLRTVFARPSDDLVVEVEVPLVWLMRPHFSSISTAFGSVASMSMAVCPVAVVVVCVVVARSRASVAAHRHRLLWTGAAMTPMVAVVAQMIF